jgi:alkanesulfonate monooxygenase SsuD/methylene tetrahydromethanopterin reductase-like flavin-dependent oxidoreductase (luciferase family)
MGFALMTVDFGLALPPGPVKGKPTAQWLDDLDAALARLQPVIRSLWITDHFFWDDQPTYEATTNMAFMAAHYPRLDIGSAVFGQSYRNPALLAKLGATLQLLSGGRYIMGIGAGWKEDEYHACGYPFPAAKIRMEQLQETLEITKMLWTLPGKVSFHGRHYQLVDAYCEPKPDPIPTIMVGGGGKTTMLLAAHYADWWNHSDVDFAAFSEKVDILKQHCQTVGRDLSTLRLTWFGRLSLGRTPEEARQRAITQGREHFSAWLPDQCFWGTPQQVVEQLKPFVGANVNYFMFEILSLNQPGILDMALEVFERIR